MLLPLSLICDKKDMRKDGTSVVFIQYCYSSEKRTNLNTGVAIPAKYWSKKRQIITGDLPTNYGSVEILLQELKQKLRFAEDLVELAMRKNIQNKEDAFQYREISDSLFSAYTPPFFVYGLYRILL